ncbi:MAG: hypothetical protein HON90_13565 [Halobacteriovoraceae bacterium]|jgi:hypothetical protein|nr:hypothetical protein [Halobacteriovoraceae bacterium]
MNRVSVNPALIYSRDAVKPTELKQGEIKKEKQIIPKAIKNTEAVKVELSEKSKQLKEELSSAEKAMKIHSKKFGKLEKPGIYFLSGFDWLGASSVKGNYDGIRDMADAIEGAEHFSWTDKEEVIADIKKRRPDQPVVLVGHSFGGDSIVEIAQELNTIENGFRKIDLLVTLDSVGTDNDFIPQNVKKNLNYIAQGPYDFLNDGPNIALNYQRSKVDNFLRHEQHADLDDATDIQINILEEIEKALS